MRVIAGTLGGRRLRAPRGLDTRPTSDRVREALFMALGPLEGCPVVDLFAGSGALGIEALSRGATHALFVESDRAACALIAKNVESLGLSDRAEIACSPAERLVASGPSTGPFDLIFADPPYRIGPALAAEVLAMARTRGWLAPSAFVAVEHARDAQIEAPTGFTVKSRRTYGDTAVTILVAGPEA